MATVVRNTPVGTNKYKDESRIRSTANLFVFLSYVILVLGVIGAFGSAIVLKHHGDPIAPSGR